MGKIKAISVAFNEAGSQFVVDDKGQIWVKQKINGEWVLQELPENETTVPNIRSI